MIEKPSGCIGCPFYKHGKHFTPDLVNKNSKVFFLAQNPGSNEEAGQKLIKRHYFGYNEYHDEYANVQPQPLIGATGALFDNKFLPLSGLKRSEISLGNAIRCRPGASLGLKSDELPKLTTAMKLEHSNADIVKALKHCNSAYLHIPSSTQVVVTMGRYAMFALTGIQNEENEYGKRQGVMESWRGYGVDINSYNHPFNTVDCSQYYDLRSGKIILFTMHIAALFKGANKRFYHATKQDFNKIKLFLNNQWPKPLPTWSTDAPTTWPKVSCFDTEYNPSDNSLIRYSLYDATNDHLHVVDSIDVSERKIHIAQNSTVLMQNALADIAHLTNIVDFSSVKVEDLMLAHSVLWTGEPHSLNYIASKYGAFNRYKHLSSSEPQLYSALDAYEPFYIWRNSIIPDFKKDQQSYRIYKGYRLPLIDIINKAQQTGIPLNSRTLNKLQDTFYNRLQEIQDEAKLITGDRSFNIGGSKRIKEEIYG